MSSESESEQHSMETGSKEDSESEEVESQPEIEELESGSEEAELASEDEESESEEEGNEGSDSENENVADSDSDECDEEEKPPKSTKQEKKIPFDQPKNEFKKNILEKYEKLKGKSLYVRFPHKLPIDPETVEKNVKQLCSRIIKVRRPRQRSIRFCMVDFDNSEDRNKAMKELQKVEINGSKLIVSIPRTENDDYVQKLIELKTQKKLALAAKLKLKKAARQKQKESVEGTDKKERIFTSTIIIQNIPSETTMPAIKNLFPKAVDVKINFARGKEDTTTATVTMATPKDATKAKRNKYKIGENELRLSFAINKKGKNKKQKEESNDQKSDDVNGQSLVQKPSKGSKAGKHKLEGISSDDLPSLKKKKKSLKKEDDGENHGELMAQYKKHQKAISKENSKREKKGVKENKTVQKNVSIPNLQKTSPKVKPKLFKKDNKAGKPFTKENKAGKPFKKANKAGKPFKKLVK